MNNLHFTIDIKAPKEKVWDTMLGEKTYPQWTDVFSPTGSSYYEGNWDEGGTIRFVGADDNGKLSGVASKVAANRKYEFISLEVVAEIVDGKEDPDTEYSKKAKGGHENYTFTEKDGVTTVDVDLDSNDDSMEEMFGEAWPKALAKLKELAEK